MGENDKELDEYGVWVTTEEEELPQEFSETLEEQEEMVDFSLDDHSINDIEIDLENQAINKNSDEDDFFIFDDQEESDSQESSLIPIELETEKPSPATNSLEEAKESNDEEGMPTSFEPFSLSESDELQTEEEEKESYDTLEENLFAEENEKETITDIDWNQTEKESGETTMNEQSDVLQTILAEIKNIKSDIEGIKSEINDLKRDKNQCKDPDEDFFDDDEKISLSSDELDELNDLNIAEESFSDEENQEEMTLDQELNAKMEGGSFSFEEDSFSEDDDFGIDLEDSDMETAQWEKEKIESQKAYTSSSFEPIAQRPSFSSSTASLEEELNEAKGEMIGSVEDMMYDMDEDAEFELDSKLNDRSFDDLIDTENYNHSLTEESDEEERAIATDDEKDHFQMDRETEAEENQEISFDLDGATEQAEAFASSSEQQDSFETIESSPSSIEKEPDFEADLDFETTPAFGKVEEDLNVAAKVSEELAKADELDDEDLEFEDFTIENLEDENSLELEEQSELAVNSDFETGAFSKSDLIALLSYLDNLLDALPDEKVREFASSPYFDLYKKAFKELGIKE